MTDDEQPRLSSERECIRGIAIAQGWEPTIGASTDSFRRADIVVAVDYVAPHKFNDTFANGTRSAPHAPATSTDDLAAVLRWIGQGPAATGVDRLPGT